MRLFLLRHGHAEHTPDVNDFDRQLTAAGADRMRSAARVMASLDLKLTHLYASPRVRARQTAAIAAESLGVSFEVKDELGFAFGATAIRQMTHELDANARIMFVGHEPSLSSAIADITGADVIMKPGGLARIDVLNRSQMRGTLVWLLAPKVFDALGRG
jgi:phosphohistidine phosphatase